MPKNVGVILTLKDRFSSKLKDVATKLDTTEKKLQKATMTVRKFSDSMGKGFEKAVVGVGAGMTALVATTGVVVNKTAEMGDRVDKLSQKIGLSRRGFQEWDYVCSQSGMSVESLQMGMKTLVNQIDKVASGNKDSTATFRKLGVSVRDANGNLKNQEQVFNECVIALTKMKNGSEKAKIANDLFGRSGAELAPIIQGSADTINELKDRANQLGLVMSDELVDNCVEFGDLMDDVKKSASMLGAGIASALMPSIIEMQKNLISELPKIQAVATSVFGAMAGTIKFVVDNMNILIPIASACVSSIVAFKTISTVITVISTLQKVIQAISVAQGIWNALMLANPIGLIAMGIGALIGLIVLLVANWDKITKAVGRAIAKMKEFVGIKPRKDKHKPEVDVPEVEETTEKPSRHALGTPYFQGGATSINEGGRGEIVNLPSGSQIVPHDIVRNNNKHIELKVEFNIAGNMVGNRELFEQFADMLLNKVESKLQTV